MKYCELCQGFYISTTVGGLKNVTSQGDIAKFFVEVGLKEESQGVLPLNISSFNKWFSGENGQKPAVWKTFAGDFGEDAYVKAVGKQIDKNNIKKVAFNLKVIKNEAADLDINRFVVAIARQMNEFAQGKGEAKNILIESYEAYDIQSDLSDYLEKSINRHKIMKLVGDQEVLLRDYYVCNFIGDKPGVFADRAQVRCQIIENATLDKIKTFDKRIINYKTLLIGNGGMGKTLMLQHLFLNSAEEYAITGIMPIFVELRYYKQGDDLWNYIFDAVKKKDETFTEEIAQKLMFSGNCQLLFDGLDEIDPSDISSFQKELTDLIEKYPKIQIVIATRECDAINSIRGFVKLFLWPFNNEQSLALIDKVLVNADDKSAKDKVLEYMNKGFIKKDGAFASNPMLLTFVALKYPMYEDFYGDHLLFYKAAYETMLYGHDKEKESYDRIFYSVDSAEDFSIVFREFCGKSYSHGIFEFTKATFDQYFNKLVSYKEFKNPYKMDPSTFRHDACSTACMMYEQNLDIYYIDPGFQEYLFAEYYAEQDSEKVREMAQELLDKVLGDFGNYDAFEMLYKFSRDKMEVCIFKPFLDAIFKGKNDSEAFAQFLCLSYDNLSYTVTDKDLIQEYEEESNARQEVEISSVNEPRTVILSYILKLLNEPAFFTFDTHDSAACYDEYSTAVFTGEIVGLNGKEKALCLRRVLKKQYEDTVILEKTNAADNFIRGRNGEVLCFGQEYVIDSYEIEENPGRFSAVLNLLQGDSCGIHGTYEHLKDYYKKLVRKQKRNAFI